MSKWAAAFNWNSFEVFYGDPARQKKKTPTKEVSVGKIPGLIRIPSSEEIKAYFETAQYPYSPGTHWCGVFQTHCLVKAGVACHWNRRIVDDSGGTDLEIVQGKEAKRDLKVGDIVVISQDAHHFMITEPAVSGWLPGFEGNAGGPSSPMLAYRWGANMWKNRVENIVVRYRVVS